ncbi:9997_t:CDS:2 [Diversispora eburnea]|uniref:9997_t:CDS:1 n=1 Tax=Diversispora eburnea TaxID=1213867 RepID=A0A9N8YZY1_9GLOM|nr:9997_t:CDS:2 [Diversispora eburnea]
MQHQLARSLSGELKRILIPNASTSAQQQSVSQQESYKPPGLEDSNSTDRALENGNYEDAFVAVLASHELPLILRLCSKVNPKTVFSHARSLLSQPVILSLIHHLSLELNKYPDLKLTWMEEAVIKLNPKDHIIREHCERLLPLVKQRLEQYYYQIATQDPSSPNLKNISLLIHVVNSLLQ